MKRDTISSSHELVLQMNDAVLLVLLSLAGNHTDCVCMHSVIVRQSELFPCGVGLSPLVRTPAAEWARRTSPLRDDGFLES
jgi:hypothetical protein